MVEEMVSLNITRRWIKAAYGEKCKEYEDGCCVCRVWFLFENLENYFKFVSPHDLKAVKKGKKK
jgi:hypothetical protein